MSQGSNNSAQRNWLSQDPIDGDKEEPTLSHPSGPQDVYAQEEKSRTF